MNFSTLKNKIQTAKRLSPHLRARATRITLQNLVRQRVSVPFSGAVAKPAALAFHVGYYDNPNTWQKNSWMGMPVQQFPSDLYLYQEIIAQKVPDYIIQTGVFDGGSALFLAQMLDLAGAPSTAKVIAIDIELRPKTREITHPRVHLIEGSSTAPEVIAEIERVVSDIPVQNGGMVSLDSDHSARHVANELAIYPRFVGAGNYLVVEDTNVNGHPVLRSHGPGPREGMNRWMKAAPGFVETDIARRQMFSAHTWLQRES